jgi:CBS domain containing-hemolysin-like protein
VTGLALAVAALIVLVTGLLRAAGASLVRTPRADAVHDAADGDRRAARVAELLEERARVQPALGMIHTGLLVSAAIPAAWALSRLAEGPALLVALVSLGVLLVLAGDLVPRGFGRRRPSSLAYRFAWLLQPAIALGHAAADLISDLDEDIVEEDDADDVQEKELISSVLDFTDTLVREVLVPRIDMVTLAATSTAESALDVILEAGRSRIPVLGDGIDNVEGVLYARDLLTLMDEGGEESTLVRELMRSAYFVPETKRVSELLREMQASQVHLAIVVDEFGGTAGLVTIEDLLEELVGEIADEYDDEAPMVTQLGEGSYLIDARLGIDELGQLIGAELPDEEWDTVGGLILGLAGRVPKEGETFELEEHVFTADRVQGRRVSRVRVHSR